MNNALITIVTFLLVIAPQSACGPLTSPIAQSQPKSPADQPSRSEPGGTQTTGGGSGGGAKKNSPPPVLGPVQAGPSLGSFSYERRSLNGNPIIRYKKNLNAVTRDQFITLLTKDDQEGRDFRTLVNKSIANLPPPTPGKVGYQLQAPLINAATKNDAFYWVAYEDAALGAGGGAPFANYLLHCNPAPAGAHAAADYLARFHRLFAADNNAIPHFIAIVPNDPLGHGPKAQGAVIFKGGYAAAKADEIMVSPCTLAANWGDAANVALGHIYTFAQTTDADPLKQKLAQSFWFAVGKAARRMFDGTTVRDIDLNPKAELYLSIHGHGIHYLHLRLENSPLYYIQIPELKNAAQSRAYYNSAAFP